MDHGVHPLVETITTIEKILDYQIDGNEKEEMCSDKCMKHKDQEKGNYSREGKSIGAPKEK